MASNEKKSSIWETILPSGITGVASLLGSILSGSQKEKERKRSFAEWQKGLSTQLSKLREVNLGRYQTSKDLPTIDPLMKKLFVGRVSSTLKPEEATKYGIDFNAILNALRGSATGAVPGLGAGPELPEAGPGLPNKQLVNADDVLRKYAMAA